MLNSHYYVEFNKIDLLQINGTVNAGSKRKEMFHDNEKTTWFIYNVNSEVTYTKKNL